MGNFTLLLACVLGIGVIVMMLKRITGSQPKWQRVYFFLVSEWHRKKQRSYVDIQLDLMERYGLSKYEAGLCLDHWCESSDWFESQDWLNDKKEYNESVS